MNTFSNIRADGVQKVANSAERLLLFPSDGYLVEQLDDNSLWAWNQSLGTWVDISGGGGSGLPAFGVIDTPAGTDPTALTQFDTLSLTSNDSSVVITGNSSTNTVDLSVTGGTYSGASPTTVTVGGLTSGTSISGLTFTQIFEDILVPYIAPTFSTFTISGQSQTLETGLTVSGSKSFAWTFTNSGNISANTMTILDVTGSTTLASGLSITSPHSVSVGTVTNSAPGSYSWRGQVTDIHSTVINSSLFTINWFFRRYVGTSANTTLTESQIEALVTTALTSTFAATYAMAAGDYKYFCWPDSFGSPTASTGFKDTATNLAISMADSGDNAAYSNVQNGWSYALVSVTNVNSITTNYRVYRSKNTLGGSINIQVS